MNFRIAADVLVVGEDLGNMLVEAGVAARYDGGKKSRKWCKQVIFIVWEVSP